MLDILSIFFISVFCASVKGIRHVPLDDQVSLKILDRLLNDSIYDKRRRPHPGNRTQPTTEFSAIMFFRQSWTDARLKYVNPLQNTTEEANNDTIVFAHGDLHVQRMWLPDLFFLNERRGHQHVLAQPNTMMRIFPSGNILYSVRYSFVFSCYMNLVRYPFDTQVCYIQFGCYSYTTSSQVYRWAESYLAVEIYEHVRLPKFQLVDHKNVSCRNEISTGDFSCLRLNLYFNRQLGYHFGSEFMPNILLVMASWISFWLDPKAAPARVTLAITTMLTTFAHHRSIKDSLPPVSYTKAIDIWTGTCTVFVFLALVEYAIVNVLAQKETTTDRCRCKNSMQTLQTDCETRKLVARDNEKNKKCRREKQDEDDCDEPITNSTSPPQITKWYRQKLRGRQVDCVSRYLFPLSFSIFCVFYTYIYAI